MQKPSFGVVTGVVVVLSALAFAARSMIEFIPPGPPNRLAAESADFLQRASHEPIDWRVLDDSLFADARKRDLPIMLVVGSDCSPKGRFADSEVFASRDVRGLLARRFLSARVDSMARPEIASCFLPVSRALSPPQGRVAVSSQFQIWFLDPRGHLFGFAPSTAIGNVFNDGTLFTDLQAALDRFAQIQANVGLAGVEQQRDLASIEAAFPEQLPDLTAYANRLTDAAAPAGGTPIHGVQYLWPQGWRFLLRGRRFDAFRASILPCLTSPMVDLLDGGFFAQSATLNWRSPSYDKLATTNADMAQTLALAANLTHDDRQRWLAQMTMDCLLKDFVRTGFFASGQVGDEDQIGRSERSSFSPRALRDRFPNGADRDWLRRNLGLRVETNPQMTPMLTSLTMPLTQPKVYDSFIERLRQDREPAQFAGEGMMDVGGFACARILDAARILGDTDRMEQARNLFDRLDRMRTFDDVVHAQSFGTRGHVYLGDYLAYADGALQCFLTTGNPEYLKSGVAVLRRGLFLYQGKVKGEYYLSQPSLHVRAIQDAAAPEIVDRATPSCSAQIMGLANDYGRLLGIAGSDLTAIATEVQSRFAPIAPLLGPFAAGYFCAASNILDSSWAVVAGPFSVRDANRLATLVPDRLIAPASGPVGIHLAKPGIYVVQAAGIRGPFTEAQAVKLLARPGF